MVSTQTELLIFVERLQTFFNIPRTVVVPKNATCDLFSAVAMVIRKAKTNQSELQYLRGNLGFGKGTTPQAVAEEVEQYRDRITEDCTSYFRIDTALRNIVVPLRDYHVKLTNQEIQQITTWLKPLAAIEAGSVV